MVRAKKHLGQHFLKDRSIARRIVNELQAVAADEQVLEIGPGTGVLTFDLLKAYGSRFHAFDLDEESIAYLHQQLPQQQSQIRLADFLQEDLSKLTAEGPLHIIGNFPYNISSQIFFKVIDHRDKIPQVVGMLQKEVAERLAAPHGSRTYGIISVLLQVWYDVEYLFTLPPDVFQPPPKVNSGVLRARRNGRKALECDEKLFKQLVKQAFQMRRKKLRNALKPLNLPESSEIGHLLDLRAEALSIESFISLTLVWQRSLKNQTTSS